MESEREEDGADGDFDDPLQEGWVRARPHLQQGTRVTMICTAFANVNETCFAICYVTFRFFTYDALSFVPACCVLALAVRVMMTKRVVRLTHFSPLLLHQLCTNQRRRQRRRHLTITLVKLFMSSSIIH